jgi:hypothetical protein
MNNEFVKLVEQTLKTEDVIKGIEIAKTTGNMGKAKEEINKDVDSVQVENAHKIFMAISKKAETSTGTEKEFWEKLKEMVKNFYNRHSQTVGKQASYVVAADAKTKKGFKGFKTKAV